MNLIHLKHFSYQSDYVHSGLDNILINYSRLLVNGLLIL